MRQRKIKELLFENGTFFTIEEGNVCGGNIDKALKFIKLVKEVGANAVEFQLAVADDFYTRNHTGYEIFKKLEYSEREISTLISLSHELGLQFVAVPLSQNLITKLVELGVDAFNINASDINNPSIIDTVCKQNLPFFISLPLASEEEIEWAVNRCKINNNENFCLLLGQHTMASGENGVKPQDTNLGYIKTLKKLYNKPVGFIDHTHDIYMPSIALASDADCVSKHMAFSREEKGSDWFICLEPDEMKRSIDYFFSINISLKNINKTFAPGEKFDKSIMRRSIVAAQNLKMGIKITEEDICFKRPGNGIPPSEFSNLLGKRVQKNVVKDQIITYEDLL